MQSFFIFRKTFFQLKKYLDKLPLILIFFIAVAFSIKSFREPDLWWQIRTGEWILEHHEIPKHDIFSYTFEGKEWINVKWGSEVLFALITKFSGPESVFVIQAIVSCLLVFFLIKISIGVRSPKSEVRSKTIPLSIAFLASLVAIEYRIIGRPEMFSHLFVVVFLFFQLRHRKELSNKIFWLIPLQILWTNLHEAYGTGIVITGIFFVGAWLEYFLAKRKIAFGVNEIPKAISILLPLQLLSVVVNPNGIKLITQPLAILGQVYENKFTMELYDFRSPSYWLWNVYWEIGAIVIGALGVFLYFKTLKAKSNRFKLFVEHFGLGYLLALVAFFYLAATAYRNIVFLVLVFFPLLVFGIDSLLNKIPSLQRLQQQITIVVCILLFSCYSLVVSNKYYEWTNSRDRFGLEVLSTLNASGAADFILQNKIHGKCFSDYLTSSYLMWKLQPDFKTFIDLRDLDVFPSDFFGTFFSATAIPDSFERLDALYHFDYVILYRPNNPIHNYLYNESNYKLAFADPVAMVYVKKKSAADSSVVNFTPSKPIAVSFVASTVNKILNPFYSTYDYSSVDYNLIGSSYSVSVNQLDAAEEFLKRSAAHPIESYKTNEMFGELYFHRGMASADANSKNQFLVTAQNYFQQSLNEKNDFADTYLGLGASFFEQKNYPKALEAFENCLERDHNNRNACIYAGECCSFYINQNNSESPQYLERALTYFNKADKLQPGTPFVMFNLGLLYFRKNDCTSSLKYLKDVAVMPGVSDEQRSIAKNCLQKCGGI